MVETKKRDFLFDNLKCIGIVLVVFAHLLEGFDTPATNVLYKIIYLFHMPLFVFVSGYYARFNLKKIVKKLVVPYLIFQFVWTIFEYFISHSNQNFLTYILTPRWVLWYLFSMIIWKLSTIALEKVNQKYLPIILIFAVVIGLFSGGGNFDGYILSISRTLAFYPFFVLGFYFKRLNFRDWHIFKENIFKFGFVVLSMACVIALFGFFPGLPREALYNAYMYNQISGYNMLVRLFMYIGATVIIFSLMMFCGKQSSLGSYLGQNSMVIYLVHGLIVRGLSMVLTKFTPYPIFISAMLTVIVIIISILVGKGWNWLKKSFIEAKKQ